MTYITKKYFYNKESLKKSKINFSLYLSIVCFINFKLNISINIPNSFDPKETIF